MTPIAFALICLSVSLSAVGQTFFKTGVGRVSFAADAGVITKASAMLFSPWVLGGLAFYAVGTVTWLFALRRLDLSLAYPFVAMSFILVTASAYIFLGESPTPGRVIGLGCVVTGLGIMAFYG